MELQPLERDGGPNSRSVEDDIVCNGRIILHYILIYTYNKQTQREIETHLERVSIFGRLLLLTIGQKNVFGFRRLFSLPVMMSFTLVFPAVIFLSVSGR